MCQKAIWIQSQTWNRAFAAMIFPIYLTPRNFMLAKPSLVCDCSPCWLLTVIKMFGLLCHVSVKNPENKSYSLRWKVLWNSSSGWLVCIYSFWRWTTKKHPLHLRGAITIRLCRITTGLGWGLLWQKRHFEYWSRIRSNMMFRKIYWSKMREKLFVKLLIIFLIPPTCLSMFCVPQHQCWER